MIIKQKGTYDIAGVDSKKREYVNDIIRSVCEKYNYNYIETPVFEDTSLFHRCVGETTDMVQKETYDFKDRGDRNITLRPEGTAGVVRWFIENKMYGNMTDPVKVYYNEKVYRYERPGSGRNREFTQFGVELLGSDDVMSDVDVISVAYQTYCLLGLNNVKIKINSLGDKESRDNYRKALLDYLKPHMSELCEDCKERIDKNPLRILDCKVDGDKDVIKNAPKTLDYLNKESLDRYNKLKEDLDLLEINYEEDPRLVRGLDYYNHIVFEVYADTPSMSNLALGGGGRYNGLIELLDGPSIPAVGFAMGYDRTLLAIEDSKINIPINDSVDIYVMYVSDSEKDTAAYLTQNLRLNGFITETDLVGNKGLKNEFKAADRYKAKYLVILNDKDLKENSVNVKDNRTKEEEKVNINDLVDYIDMHM
jgi:histidyl-tRNA synthetase